MSGPNPPGPESEEVEPGVEPSEGDSEFEEGGSEFGAERADADGQTDVYSRAYSAPESEHVSSGPYVPGSAATGSSRASRCTAVEPIGFRIAARHFSSDQLDDCSRGASDRYP